MRSGIVRHCWVALGIAGCALLPVHASAQLVLLTHSPNQWSDRALAYDPAHDAYFAISGGSSVTGRFIDRYGNTIGSPITLDVRRPEWWVNRVVYSADISNGSGGVGGFVAIWAPEYTGDLVAQRVAFPGRLVGPPVTIRAGTTRGRRPYRADIAYSPTHHVFLVAYALFGFPDQPTRITRLALSLQPLSDVPLSPDLSRNCSNFEFIQGCNETRVLWNPASDEFGVLFSHDSEKTLARVRPDGTIARRTTLGIPDRFGAMAVNTSTGNYVALGASYSVVFGAEISPVGDVLARGAVTTMLLTDSAGVPMDLSYNPASGTFLLIGRSRFEGTSGGSWGWSIHHLNLLELDAHGAWTGSTLSVPFHFFAVAALPAAAEWIVVSQRGTYLIGTQSRSFTPSCTTSDPFVGLGGGTCWKGGWLPPGMTAAPLRPCTTPDPFIRAGLGEGACVNGGWLPAGIVSPPPAAVPGGCTTPDPFSAVGGGTCVNGGWLPPGMPRPLPTVLPGGCATPDPFVSIGGGVCANGGWTPRPVN